MEGKVWTGGAADVEKSKEGACGEGSHSAILQGHAHHDYTVITP